MPSYNKVGSRLQPTYLMSHGRELLEPQNRSDFVPRRRGVAAHCSPSGVTLFHSELCRVGSSLRQSRHPRFRCLPDDVMVMVCVPLLAGPGVDGDPACGWPCGLPSPANQSQQQNVTRDIFFKIRNFSLHTSKALTNKNIHTVLWQNESIHMG